MAYLSAPGLKALGWTFIAIDIILTVGRYILRWNTAGAIGIPHGIKRFGVEDGLHLLALLAAITYVALQSSGLALFIKLEIYNQTHKDRLNLEDENHFFHIRFGAILVFWICLYSVKFAFLMFYRTLFWVSHPFRKYWYAVSAFTLLSFLVSFLACFWVCGWPVNPLNLQQCLRKHSVVQNNIEYLWCAINTLSSVLIFMLPLFMLRGLRMRFAQKISLAAIFVVASADIVFDIARTFYTTKSVGLHNLWRILEITIAVMLSALMSYRKIFSTRRKKTATTSASSRRLVQQAKPMSGPGSFEISNRSNGDPSKGDTSKGDPSKSDAYRGLGDRDYWETDRKYGGSLSVTQLSSSSFVHPEHIV